MSVCVGQRVPRVANAVWRRSFPRFCLGFVFFFQLFMQCDAAIEVQDFAGRTLVLEQPAQRIIALAPHIVENVFSAGAGQHLVGVVSYSDYPDAARGIAQVGDFRSWSLEAIVELQPDLILLWGSGNGMERLGIFEQLGLPVFVTEPRALEDIPRAIRLIGALAGTQVSSDIEARRIEESFASLRAAQLGKPVLSVFYQIWNDPLQTVNGQHMISSILELCSARNVFADAQFLAPKITLEAVLARDPDVIVASGMSAARPQWLDEWQTYPSLKAVRNEALVFVNPDHMQRATARVLLGAEDLCAQLEPLR